MAREHRDRYANAADLLADLRRIELGRAPAGPHRMRLDLLGWGQRLSRRPKARLMAVTLAVAALSLFLLWPQACLRTVWSFESQHITTRWREARTADWNGDGAAELLVTEGNKLLIFTGQGSLYTAVPFEEPATKNLNVEGAEDADHDGLADAWASWNTSETNLHLSLVVQGRRLKTFDASGASFESRNIGSTSYLRPIGLAAGRGPESRRLFAALATAHGASPRGICCYDYANTNLLWRYPVGPLVGDAELLDLNGDGFKDVVFGSNAPDNTNAAPDGSDDAHSYLFALSHDGRLLWRTNLTDCEGNLHVLGRGLRLARKVNLMPKLHYLVECRLVGVARLAPAPQRAGEVGRDGRSMPGNDADDPSDGPAVEPGVLAECHHPAAQPETEAGATRHTVIVIV